MSRSQRPALKLVAPKLKAKSRPPSSHRSDALERALNAVAELADASSGIDLDVYLAVIDAGFSSAQAIAVAREREGV